MWTFRHVALGAALALLGLSGGRAEAGYFPPRPTIVPGVSFSRAVHAPLYSRGYFAPPFVHARPQLTGLYSGQGLSAIQPQLYNTSAFPAFSYGRPGLQTLYSGQGLSAIQPHIYNYNAVPSFTYGPPVDFYPPGDAFFYPFGTTGFVPSVPLYNYSGYYVGPLLYRP